MVLFFQGLSPGQLNLFSIHSNVASLTRPLHSEEQQLWSATLLLGWVFLTRYKMAERVERSLSDELGDWSVPENSGRVRHEKDSDWTRRVESKGRLQLRRETLRVAHPSIVLRLWRMDRSLRKQAFLLKQCINLLFYQLNSKFTWWNKCMVSNILLT